MAAILISPATAERFEDVQHALTGGGDGGSCQCQWWTMSSAEYGAATRDEKTERLRIELATSAPSPALVAYVDGEPAGWVRVGPRAAQVRLRRSRVLTGSPRPWDDAGVWAVTCFVVRREHRGRGLMRALLAGAIEHARAHGARVIEAYPIDTAVADKRTNDLFVGTLNLFLDAGFREVARPAPHRPVVDLDLSG